MSITADRLRAGGSPTVLLTMCLGLMLSMFNSTLVNVTLPAIGTSFAASTTQLQWISSAYTLCYAAMLLPGGAVGNRWGRRRAFLVGIGVFLLASVVCAIAPGLAVLLVGRVAQALGAAWMLPQTLATLVHEYADLRARSRAVGVWAGVASLGLSAGPVLGGVILSITTWRAGFWLCVVLAALTVALGVVAVPASRHGRPAEAPSVDLVGAGLSVVGLTALVFALIESGTHGWDSPLIWVCLAVFVVGALAFVALQERMTRRGEVPLMPLRLWRSRGFVAANVAGLVYFLAFYGILFFFSLDLQQVRGHSALATGLSFLPMTLVMAVLGPVAGRLTSRYGALRVLTLGLVIAAVGSLLLGLLPHEAGLADLEWRLAVVGLGAGLMSSPMSTAAVSSVDAAHSSTASAVHNTFRQIGATLGVAALGVVVGATAAPGFAAGLDHAMLVVAALLACCAALTAALRPAPGPLSRP